MLTPFRQTARCGQPRGFSSVGRALAWHARGQGFESPKLHVSTVQKHISILKMIFDFLHCQSCRWSLASGSGPGVLARQSTPADPGRQLVPLEGRSPGAKVGANGDRRVLPRARERVAVARQSRQPSATRRHLSQRISESGHAADRRLFSRSAGGLLSYWEVHFRPLCAAVALGGADLNSAQINLPGVSRAVSGGLRLPCRYGGAWQVIVPGDPRGTRTGKSRRG